MSTPTITESTAALAALVAKIDTFVNGDVDAAIQTGSGPLKSLAGTTKQISNIQYVAKATDYNTLAEMLSDAGRLGIGELARVNLDLTPRNIGIYQKTSGGMVKIRYADLYDLNDRLPQPWNAIELKFAEADTAFAHPLIEARIPVSENFIGTINLEGRIDYTSDVMGGYSTSRKFLLSLGGKGATIYDSEVTIAGVTTIFDNGSVTVTPTLTVSHANVGGQHVFTVSLTPAAAGATTMPGNGSVVFNNIDPVKITVL